MGYISATRIATVQFNFQPPCKTSKTSIKTKVAGAGAWLHSSFMQLSTSKIMHFESFNKFTIENGTSTDILVRGKVNGSKNSSREREIESKLCRETRERQGRASKKMEFLWLHSRYRAGEKSGCQSPLIPFLPPFLEFPFSSPLQNSLSSSYF